MNKTFYPILTATFEEWINSIPEGAQLVKHEHFIYCKDTNQMYWFKDVDVKEAQNDLGNR